MNNQGKTIKEQLLAGKTTATFTTGVSMKPLLYENKTHVIIQSICLPDGSRAPLKKGELPIYLRPDGKYVIHRLIDVDSTYYYTRGDNCITSERIAKEWVLGRVVEIHRKGKNINVNEWHYRLYVFFWNTIFPVRRFLRQLRGKVRELL